MTNEPTRFRGIARVRAEAGDSLESVRAEINGALEKIRAASKDAADKTRELAEGAVAEAKKTGDLSAKTKEKADEALLKVGEIQARLTEVEQLAARVGQSGSDRPKSLGGQFVDDPKVKEFLASSAKRGRVDMTVNAAIISSDMTDTAGAAGDLVAPDRRTGVQMLPDRRLVVRDLLTPGTTSSNTLEYVKETGFTNAAAPIAEKSASAQSDIKFDLVSVGVKRIGHHMKASRTILDDAPGLQSVIDGRLRYGVAFVEEALLLNGDGTGQNPHGVIPQATAYTAPIALTSPTSIDVLRLAMLQAALAEYPATGHVMNPIDWAWIETLKDGEGRYIIGNPQGTASPTLWGLPVVTTQAISVDKFLTGAFRLGAQIFDRQQSRVEIATENEDDFVKNLITMQADERLALAVYRPEAFIYGDFGRVA